MMYQCRIPTMKNTRHGFNGERMSFVISFEKLMLTSRPFFSVFQTQRGGEVETIYVVLEEGKNNRQVWTQRKCIRPVPSASPWPSTRMRRTIASRRRPTRDPASTAKPTFARSRRSRQPGRPPVGHPPASGARAVVQIDNVCTYTTSIAIRTVSGYVRAKLPKKERSLAHCQKILFIISYVWGLPDALSSLFRFSCGGRFFFRFRTSFSTKTLSFRVPCCRPFAVGHCSRPLLSAIAAT